MVLVGIPHAMAGPRACPGLPPRTSIPMRIIALWCCALLLAASEIDGVVVPATATVDGQVLALRGADLLRWKWIVKIYVAACWLPAGAVDPVVAAPKRLAFTYRREFSAADLIKATNSTIVAGLTEAEHVALAPSLARWNAGYPAVVAGDHLVIDHLTDGTAVLSVNGVELVRVTDPAFARALCAIWLGPKTFDTDLRAALIGG